jgi:protein arginine kinase
VEVPGTSDFPLRVKIPPPQWLTEAGPEGDVVLSTRCRLARNLSTVPFPWRAMEGERKQVAQAILEAVERCGSALGWPWQVCADLVDAAAIIQLLEWRYVSRAWLEKGTNRWLFLWPDRVTSLLVNEEDHLRLQAILPGLQVASSQEIAMRTERALASFLSFAYDGQAGYLTASLNNAGTGLRMSVLLHLVGLAASGKLRTVLEAAIDIGCSVRGLYGEGSCGTGEFFQVSNTYRFGMEPLQVAEKVDSAVKYIVDAERQARQEQFGTASGRAALKSRIGSVLRSLFHTEEVPCRLLPHVSTLRLGVVEGILPGSLACTNEWVALAGVEEAWGPSAEQFREHFEVVRRSAWLRQRLRNSLQEIGTFLSSYH